MHARFVVTAHYIGSILILIVVFNFGVYGLFVSDLPDKTQATLTPSQQLLIDQAGQSLQRTLLWVDSVMLIAIALVGYYLARRALKPIEASYKMQQQFVADAAHELRTPLAVVKTASEAVLSGKHSKQELKKLAEDTLEEVNALSRVADDMLFLAKQDEQPSTVLSRVDLVSLVRRCIVSMGPYAASRDITLAMHHSKHPGYMQGNADDIKRLLNNLTQNAITYNRPGGSVKFFITNQGQSLKFVVTDTGIGIPQVDQPHVFDRFYKADKARSEQSAGAGLGLTIVQKIVRNHHGTITLVSTPIKGTEITILFPLSS